ncbi:hypothetical protein DBR37_08970 [Herminiimonas sp. KBW02]|uniref:hypothetical protein n=1 Tax=Herminiimonas sp. KBW02 TaxID=2153363 RepID=UPI000F5972E9|nr:hypothetical protein [Herminiimonas sp. KBW02]RQO36431.1 hypothetical protein DBR37_08970 [Herminiimonas sp. KBW02]
MLRKFAKTVLLGCAFLGVAGVVTADESIPVYAVALRGTEPVTLKGRLQGPEKSTKDFIVLVKQGETLTVSLKASKANSTYFNILPPDDATALFVGEMQGANEWRQRLDVSGNYTVRIYLNRAVARKGVKSDYTLKISAS